MKSTNMQQYLDPLMSALDLIFKNSYDFNPKFDENLKRSVPFWKDTRGSKPKSKHKQSFS